MKVISIKITEDGTIKVQKEEIEDEHDFFKKHQVDLLDFNPKCYTGKKHATILNQEFSNKEKNSFATKIFRCNVFDDAVVYPYHPDKFELLYRNLFKANKDPNVLFFGEIVKEEML